jgi:hypothetical protein
MKRLLVIIAVLVLLGAAGLSASAAFPTQSTGAMQAQSAAIKPSRPDGSGALVLPAVRSDVSAPLRSIPAEYSGSAPNSPSLDAGLKINPNKQDADAALQSVLSPLVMPTPIVNFEGIPNYWGGIPPDTIGDVGRNHYVQMVNVGFSIYNKTGTRLYGPANNNTLFRGFGGPCETTNSGDPVVVYDHLADRWVLSQFTNVFGGVGGTDYICFAVSTTADPLDTYYRYQIASPANRFPDYYKVTVWPDGYYMTSREFAPGYVGLGAYAVDRDKMLRGDPSAAAQYFHLNSGTDPNTTNGGSDRWLPSDLDGTPPPVGTPNYFATTIDDGNGGLQDAFLIREFHVDWAIPANSTFTLVANLPVAAFDSTVCSARPCIPQPGTSVLLDSLTSSGTGILWRLQYRNFGTHQALVAQQTVDAGAGRAGLRWYEVRAPGAGASIFQQGTHAPADAHHRWMGSIAMDKMGNIALGYSVSSSTQFPSIWYAGRLTTDPLGQMAQGEAVLINGAGSQVDAANRWGDYSSMNVDPVDECTFWYTTEYYTQTSSRGWQTRIGSFRFPTCTTGGSPTPVATATGGTRTSTPTPQATATSCPASTVITGSITLSDPTHLNRPGRSITNVSTCANVTTCTAVVVDGFSRHYDTHSYTNNTGSAQCITVNIDATQCGPAALFSVAYLGSFDPSNLCTNYLADPARPGPTMTYSFNLGPGQTAVILITESNENVGCPSYTLSINPCSTGAGGTATVTPAVTSTTTSTPQATAQATATTCAVQPTWQPAAPQNPARYTQQGAVAGDGNFYVAGGQDAANAIVPDFSRYNSGANTWTTLGNIPSPAGQVSVGASGNKVYVAGGFIGGTAITSTLRIYDIPSNTWTFGSSMPASVEAAAGVVLNGKFYVIGGDDFNASLNTNYIYDIAAGTWSTGAPLPAARTNLNGTTANGLVYVYGGEDAAFAAVNSLYAYNPTTNSWTTLASNPLGTANGNYAPITTYGAGTLMVVGGSTVTAMGAFIPHASTYFYDIASNSWSNGPALNTARTGHALGTLNDGRVIAYSGLNANPPAVTPSTELLWPRVVCATPTVAPSTTATATAPVLTSTPSRTATFGPTTGTASATRTATFAISPTITHIIEATPIPSSSATRTATSQVVTVTPTACTISFTDVPPDNVFYPFIRCLACRGIISGYDDGTFRPFNDITRGQIAKIVSNAAGFDEDPGPQIYEDVDGNNPFYQWINRLSIRGHMGGYPCGTVDAEPCIEPDNRPYFRPFNNATRGQLSKIVSNAAGINTTPSGTFYTDVQEDHPFYIWIMRLTQLGVMSGYDCGGPGEPCDNQNRPYFRPYNNVTRGQASKIVANTFFPNCETPSR